jgi:hypothetical protein
MEERRRPGAQWLDGALTGMESRGKGAREKEGNDTHDGAKV